uniref:Translocon-associated protein subunit beta n=1 Tax=Arion vulgaris TaxID=1028688 RepID=A0A0B7AMM4_9EUPU
MKLWITALILTFGCFLPSFGEEESEARLVISKNILNQYLVEGKDVTVEYKLYNVGDRVAFNVMLNENGFPQTTFSTISGGLRVTWERIAPHSNVTHAVIVRPLKSGFHNFTSAEISYSQTETNDIKIIGYSSFPGEGGIVPQKEFERRFSPRVLDWLVFAVMSLPSLGIPFVLWYGSKNRYDQPHDKSS